MIVGATGVFGSRLVEQLAVLGGVDLILAGRDAGKADVMLADLRVRNIAARFEAFDRNHPSTEKLKALAPRVIVDAAGPFQRSSLALAEAAIAASVHYIDLSDARDFVARIVSLDGAARKAGVAVISGPGGYGGFVVVPRQPESSATIVMAIGARPRPRHFMNELLRRSIEQ